MKVVEFNEIVEINKKNVRFDLDLCAENLYIGIDFIKKDA